MEKTATFDRLLKIMDDLREKCPWDKKQTIQTLRQLTIEETYELADAITDEDWKSIKEELGDIMLHMVFYAKIASEQQQFDINDVINGVCEKLIRRHPHIYGDVKAETEEQVKQNWEKLKLKEGKKSVLSGVPQSLPALVKAMRLQEKAKQTGFEWDNTQQVWDKVKEEIGELEEVANTGNKDAIEDEFGDVMFSLVNYSRFLEIDAENALERTNKKFQRRFQAMEQLALDKGQTLNDLSLVEMDALWNQVKATEK
ncbi:XTP/dITP diphosphohydrolase [Chitinophaga terrae (ex Kim and Jung 2007)]|uniref:Nucleoside triphosphate pyrophosphohydrolase n=1 Tax=Chitinophaga terrae (ex Kim and Jung 2007) TaxID=408074 RepID=A0A1H3X1M2_9BACT|nr:nucleoside triphosphate pyrophosphohydrolase [Chitinophaga terrae (ex Kim and Jung 2007)]GEP90177.1 nucleoside triphosphate pyrophosphohydrolase [Chitinophaga terrae (ex Kim and Jung 2007)]SDZ93286.1 XTP/dITP diphosphohydrolase [Chitinophaga terrae (ex Kim and Jung 2007)]